MVTLALDPRAKSPSPVHPRHLERDLRMLARFVAVYCDSVHRCAEKRPCRLRHFDLSALLGREPDLCESCAKLLHHALVKRASCPMNPKPACKHCPNHCYHPKYREQIRTVMQVAGRKLVLSGRVDLLLHLIPWAARAETKRRRTA